MESLSTSISFRICESCLGNCLLLLLGSTVPFPAPLRNFMPVGRSWRARRSSSRSVQQIWCRFGYGEWSIYYRRFDCLLGTHLSSIHGLIFGFDRSWLEQPLHAHVQVPNSSCACVCVVTLPLIYSFFHFLSSLVGGSESHKSVKKEGNYILYMYYTSRIVLLGLRF